MADKHLPIQFFEKRKDYDERSTEGGGDSKIPSWVLKGADLLQRSRMLMDEISELSEALYKHKRNGNKLPFVVCTTIEEKAIAKSHRSSIASMYASRDKSNVIGFHGDRCLLTMLTDEHTIAEINKALSDTNNQAKLISSIIDISPFYPEVDEYDEDMPFYKIRLLNYNNFDLNHAANIILDRKSVV